MPHSTEDILHKHELRKTLGRELVLRYFQSRTKAISHGELTEALRGRINRASLYRVLQDFEQSGLIHKVPDDEVSVKYAYCGTKCDTQHHHDNHVHFKCQECGETQCLDMDVPVVKLPAGLKAHHTTVLVNGICAACAA